MCCQAPVDATVTSFLSRNPRKVNGMGRPCCSAAPDLHVEDMDPRGFGCRSWGGRKDQLRFSFDEEAHHDYSNGQADFVSHGFLDP